MNTCVSMACPFIGLCKHYNFDVDRGDGCRYQDMMLIAADKLRLKREMLEDARCRQEKRAKKMNMNKGDDHK